MCEPGKCEPALPPDQAMTLTATDVPFKPKNVLLVKLLLIPEFVVTIALLGVAIQNTISGSKPWFGHKNVLCCSEGSGIWTATFCILAVIIGFIWTWKSDKLWLATSTLVFHTIAAILCGVTTLICALWMYRLYKDQPTLQPYAGDRYEYVRILLYVEIILAAILMILFILSATLLCGNVCLCCGGSPNFKVLPFPVIHSTDNGRTRVISTWEADVLPGTELRLMPHHDSPRVKPQSPMHQPGPIYTKVLTKNPPAPRLTPHQERPEISETPVLVLRPETNEVLYPEPQIPTARRYDGRPTTRFDDNPTVYI